jgi:hypothetical protein
MSKARDIADLGSNDVLDTSSSGIDVTGTVTADGLTVENSASNYLSITRDGATGHYNFTSEENGSSIQFFTDPDGTGADKRLTIDRYGDISFYEDTGTTPKFFWDASAERLGIGTDSPDLTLDVSHNVNDQYVATFQNTADNLELKIGTITGGLLNIQGATVSANNPYNIALNAEGGNVGIGKSSPVVALDVNGAAQVSGRILVGSVGSGGGVGQGYQFAGDGNTGMYQDAYDQLQFSAGGQERVRIHSDGSLKTYFGSVFNEQSGDYDFRVESDSNSTMLHVDAGNNQVNVGHNGYANVGNLVVAGAANVGSASHRPAIVGIGSFGGGIASLDTLESGWYQVTNGANWQFYHARTPNVDAPDEKIVLTFGTSATVFNENSYDRDFRVESNNHTNMLFVDAGNDRVEIGGPLRMTDKTAKIAWADGGNNYYTYIGVANHPTAGYDGSGETYWLDLRSAGGTHITLNTDSTRTANRNTYDHFTVWQKAPNQTDGRACFSVDNVGNAYFANAGIVIDRNWQNYPCITVANVSGTGVDNQASYPEFRFHGSNYDEDTWWGGTFDSDFAVNLRIDGGTYASSDRRKKVNITSLTNAVETVKQLDGVRFQIINNVGTTQESLSKSGYKMGFIAQDIEDVIPDAVKYYADEDDGTEGYNNSYSVDYGSVVALLTNAIKEQQATIEALEARIEALEA